MKMTVLYLKDEAHVLAAVTRAAPPAAGPAASDPDAVPPEVTALAGAALPVRGFFPQSSTSPNATTFSIPAARLRALTVDSDDEQLLSPRLYAVVDDKQLEVLPSTYPPQPTVPAGDPATVVVTLAADVAADTPIWLELVSLASASAPRPELRGVFRPSTPTAREIRFSLAEALSGDYDVLMLLKGFRAGVWSLTV